MIRFLHRVNDGLSIKRANATKVDNLREEGASVNVVRCEQLSWKKMPLMKPTSQLTLWFACSSSAASKHIPTKRECATRVTSAPGATQARYTIDYTILQ